MSFVIPVALQIYFFSKNKNVIGHMQEANRTPLIFIGVMWKRFGTPTKRADSGTDEEFQRAYEYFKKYKRPKVMFYFRRMPFYTTNLKELTQFRKVIQFRRQLEKLGVLFWEYDTPIDFERYVREHLTRHVLELTRTVITEPPPVGSKPSPGTTKHSPSPQARKEKTNIFLAYSHEDREEVAKIYKNLRIAGLNPWLDTEDLLPGQMWHQEIENVITKADVVVLCLSSNSLTKRGYFQKELKTAIDISIH